MKKTLSVLLLLLSLLSFSQNQEIGQNFIEILLKQKNFEKALTFLDASIKDKVTVDFLSKTSNQLDAQLGAYQNTISVTNKGDVFSYYTQFKNMALDFDISFKEDKIVGFFLKQHQEVNANDYKIKSGTIDLKGTLLEAEKSSILVVFIHGSGTNDRDETIGPNKPFKDMAEAFQKEGIASYRFDKRTKSNPETFSDESTVEDEVVVDAVAIVNHFRSSEKFKNHKIIVLGHSLGAFMMPKIANSVSLDKAVMMAGNARGLQDVIIDQYVYLNSLHPSEEGAKEVEKVSKQIEFLHSKAFDLNTKNDQLPLGLSAKYWQSLLNYKPLVEVKKVAIPLLILNGERDYQVTMKEFNLWKKTLAKTKAQFISYPKLNHLFIAGEGTPSPEEYAVKGEVDKQVIGDIITFCKL
ncbi:alpha/beta fold hydrolase [Flavobacterium facile]|uniref:alpha/beta fold hydrolase n=2 Tax=Pseudomonadati TaxID=3379134 RepID=UPI002E794784|nr:alpha/beta fold hydrolase [Flavobacterium sp. T-12]